MEIKKPGTIETITNDQFNQKVTEEQIKQIFKQLPFMVVMGPMPGAAITALLLFDYSEPVRIYTWLILVFVAYSLYLLLWLWHKNSHKSITHTHSWKKRYLLISWIAAASWGSVSLLLFSEDNFTAQMILFMAVMISAAAITVGTIVYRPVFYTIVLLLIPLIIQFSLVGDMIHYVFALGSIGYIAMLFFINSSVNKIVKQSIYLRFSNYKLASDLKVQKERAEKANMAKSNFLAVASHDLRQPLHAHGLFLGELRERLPKNGVVSRIVDNLDSSLQIISESFNSLLDISRLEAGAVDVNIQVFYIDDLMSTVIEPYRIKAESLGLTFRAVLPHYAISTDKILLVRILCNFLENAVRNTPQGKILIGCRRRNRSLLIQVWDTGCGINKDELDNIFTDYYQIKHQHKRQTRGLGLGLAVVDQLCELLGHTVSVRSVLGKGSVFSIEVPVSKEKNVLTHDLNLSVRSIHGLDGMKVLVIDDDESVLLGMTGILDSWKCNVITGSDAKMIISKIPSGYTPDVIIADYQLNDGKIGPEEIEAVKSQFNQDIGAAVITGDITSVNNDAKKGRQYPILQKPVSPAKLCALLRYIRSKN